MKNQLKNLNTGEVLNGFSLVKKEYSLSQCAELYTFKHEKTGAELLYFDRDEENKTFSICFKTLPEDSTGVFHILEHSVLNGSKKYPVKEPFVSMLQSSMQTFLNAMTYPDKTVFPVSSRNDQDFFNLMSVYLDAVFCPSIYERPEIFMQEGWHYEFEEGESEPYYNGVVFSEMKGAYSNVERLIDSKTNELLYKTTCYGYSSGGKPEKIPDLTYEQFINTHKRFYHPSNSRIFLDGNLDIEAALRFINDEYLSKYERREPDFEIGLEPYADTCEATIYYEAREDEAELSHMSATKLLCTYDDIEKIYAARILSDYLTGSNEAPLKRAFLEKGLCRDISFETNDGIYRPSVVVSFRNMAQKDFETAKALLPELAAEYLKSGFNKEALAASIEHMAFVDKEISEPYGLELNIKALDSWLYGGDPLLHIENASVFDSLREKVNTDYFEKLFFELFGNTESLVYVYALPSLTKGEDDEKEEAARLLGITSQWSEEERKNKLEAFLKMQEWQQTPDSEEALDTLPHLDLKDIPLEGVFAETTATEIDSVKVLKVHTNTNGIVYLNLYFDVSDFSENELKMLKVLLNSIGELRTKSYSAEELQIKSKAIFGKNTGDFEFVSPIGELEKTKTYLMLSLSMLEKNADKAAELINEIVLNTVYDETDKIYELALQLDYVLKQSLVSNGHTIAMKKALSAFSKENALKELLSGESFITWFSKFTAEFKENEASISNEFSELSKKAFTKNRLIVSYCGELDEAVIEKITSALPVNEVGCESDIKIPDKDDCTVEIPASVGYSAIGGNLYANGIRADGSWLVLSSLVSYGYLWNAVRVQGGAYGTGMRVNLGGNVFCYSYRDPSPENSRAAYLAIPEFLEDFLKQGAPLDDIIIGTVNGTEPLIEPSAICETETLRYLKGITKDTLNNLRKEILTSTPDALEKLLPELKKCLEGSKFCSLHS